MGCILKGSLSLYVPEDDNPRIDYVFW